MKRENLFTRFFCRTIRIYQKYVSSCFMPACRFYPTCSEYMHIAIKARGALKGAAAGIGRVLRCHPFSKGGYDFPEGKS